MTCCRNVNKNLYTGIMTFISGLLVLAIFILIIVSYSNKENNYKGRAEAYQIDVNRRSKKKNYVYSPIYHFKILNGNITIEYRCYSTSSSSSYPDLTKRTVYYNLENPNECLTEYDLSSTTLLYFLLIVPIIMLISGIFFIYREIRYICSVETGSKINYSSPVSNNNDYNPNTPVYNNNYNNTPAYNDSNSNNIDNPGGYDSYSINNINQVN